MNTDSIVFDHAAGFYDETRGYPPGIAEQVAQAVTEVGQLNDTTRLLEIGIGTGRVALPVAKHSGAYVVGVDLSLEMMQKLHDKRTTERIDSVRGDVMQLPIGDASVDHAMAAHIFHLIPDWRAALDETRRVLRPGGVLLLVYVNITPNILTVGYSAGTQNSNFVGFSGTRFIEEAGWTVARPAATVTYTESSLPSVHIDRMRRRVWSSFWSLTDDEVQEKIDAVTNALTDADHPIDRPVDTHSRLTVAAYSPPI